VPVVKVLNGNLFWVPVHILGLLKFRDPGRHLYHHLAVLVLHKVGTGHVSIDEEPVFNFLFVVHRWNRAVGYEANLEVVAVKYVYGR
jgi:hypothetical protein